MLQISEDEWAEASLRDPVDLGVNIEAVIGTLASTTKVDSAEELGKLHRDAVRVYEPSIVEPEEFNPETPLNTLGTAALSCLEQQPCAKSGADKGVFPEVYAAGLYFDAPGVGAEALTAVLRGDVDLNPIAVAVELRWAFKRDPRFTFPKGQSAEETIQHAIDVFRGIATEETQ